MKVVVVIVVFDDVSGIVDVSANVVAVVAADVASIVTDAIVVNEN